jgi:hypothetical protein
MGVVLFIFADLRHGFYTIVSNEGFLFEIALLRHAQPRKPKNEARHYSLLQMRKSAIHAEACYYSIATNETCHYSNTPIEACHYSNIPIEACHYSNEACHYSNIPNEACHYSKLSQMRHSFNKLLVFEATLVR